MSGIPTTEVQNLLNSMLGTSTYTEPTGRKVHLTTTDGSDTAAGTEVTGGSYAAQTVTFVNATSSARQIANDVAVTFTGMPAVTTPGVQGVDITDAAGTRRLAYGPLAADKIIDAGDTLSFAIGAIVLSIT